MPISQEKSVPKNIERLAHSHPEFPPKQRVAVAFAEARRAGGHAGKKSAARAKVVREAGENEG